MADVLDYQSQHYLRKFIRKLNGHQVEQLRNILKCGQSVSPAVGGVYLLANDNGAVKYHGHTHCKNPFCCPTCTALIMEQYRAKISSAIKLLHDDYFGFMFTLTIPHWSFMSCRETMEILNESWRYFRRKNLQRGHGHVFDEFNKVVPIAHHVRVMEHTWGKANGWHPHFHGIMWTKRGKEHNVLDWEQRLDAFWLKTAKRKMIQYWKKHKLHQQVLLKGETYEQLADRMYSQSNYARDNKYVQGLVFSRDSNGRLKQVSTGDYICGWGADNEVTGNINRKASHNGHYTPYQILLEAQSNPAMEKLYIDFCLAVTQKPVMHRVHFSVTGINAMIKEWNKTHPVTSGVMQKKIQDGSLRSWKVIAFFSVVDWYELSILDREQPVFSNILYVARHRREILLEYIHKLLPSFSFERQWHWQKIEDELNHVA